MVNLCNNCKDVGMFFCVQVKVYMLRDQIRPKSEKKKDFCLQCLPLISLDSVFK